MSLELFFSVTFHTLLYFTQICFLTVLRSQNEVPWMVEMTILEASSFLCTALYLQLPLAYANQLEILVCSKGYE